MKVTKAVFPVAGLGTRFLPATKANPKEMMPIVDKPLIQYAVEEAVQAGVTELIFVTSCMLQSVPINRDRTILSDFCSTLYSTPRRQESQRCQAAQTQSTYVLVLRPA